MKLGEAIKHLEESLSDPGHDWGCEECKGEHEQLLEWLRELKELRELYSAQTEVIGFFESDNKQLDESLKEAKRLLKAAVEDIVWLNEHTVDGEGRCLIETATDMETCLACPLNFNNSHICGWKHQVEALALIGEENTE